MHISDNDIALFFDGLLSEEEHKKTLAHMDECNECYLRIAAVTETVNASEFIKEETPDKTYLAEAYRTAGFEETSFFDKILNLAARQKIKFAFAGMGLIVAVFAFYLNSGDTARSRYRDMSGKETVQVSYPADGENIPADEIIFRWNEEADILTYNFIIYDTEGEIIFKTSTNSNEFELDDISGLSRGKTYLWMVEAIYKDGSKKESHLTSFNYGSP